MKRKNRSVAVAMGLALLVAAACSKHTSKAEVIVQIPAGFAGDFALEMGIKEAPPLPMKGSAYLIEVPKAGRLETSTLLTDAHVVFQPSVEGIWGYSNPIFTTGDGIPVGGKIEFFVGTKKDYEADQNRKNHSREFSAWANRRARG